MKFKCFLVMLMSLLFNSCLKTNNFENYVRTNNLKVNSNTNLFIVYKDPACYSCNQNIISIIDTLNVKQNYYFIYVTHYPDINLHAKFLEKFSDNYYVDKECKLDLVDDINLDASGFVTMSEGEIISSVNYYPHIVSSDSLSQIFNYD